MGILLVSAVQNWEDMGTAVHGTSQRKTVASSESSHDKEYEDGKDQNERATRYFVIMTAIHKGSQTREIWKPK